MGSQLREPRGYGARNAAALDVDCASVGKAISDLIHGHRWPYLLCHRMPTARP